MNIAAFIDALDWSKRGSFDIFCQSLDPAWIEAALSATGTASVRRRKLPAERVVWIVLGMGLLADRRIGAVVSHLGLAWDSGTPFLPQGPPTESAVVQALDRLGPEPLRWLFEQSAAHWDEGAPGVKRWRGLRLKALDGSSLRVADSFENAEAFGVPRSGRGAGAYPQLRVVFLLDVDTRLVCGANLGPWTTSEKALAAPLWDSLSDDTLLIVDRNYVDYALLYRHGQRGGNRHWLLRAKSNLRWRHVRQLGPEDELVELTLSPQSRKADPTLPKTMTVRAIRYQRRGFRPQTLLTSLLDPKQYPAAEVAALYHERWEIELGYDEMKTHTLERKEALLRSQSPQRVLQEAWGLIVGYNLIRIEMAQVAVAVGLAPNRISFRGALLLIRNAWLSAWLVAPAHLPALLGTLRTELALLVLPQRRDRAYRREVKIKMSNFPKKARTHHVAGSRASLT